MRAGIWRAAISLAILRTPFTWVQPVAADGSPGRVARLRVSGSERVGELPRDAVGILSGDVVASEAGGGVQQVIQGSGAGPGPLVLEVRRGPYDQQPIQQPYPLARPGDRRILELAGAAVAGIVRVDRRDPLPQMWSACRPCRPCRHRPKLSARIRCR
jgi:hypothetical protein